MTEDNQDQAIFGIEELLFTMQVYETCTQRGAFKAEELSSVGAVYDRLKAYLISKDAIVEPSGKTEITKD